MSRLSREEILRYSRHLLMPEVTLEGQEKLKAARVLCVGAGGLGSPLTLYLAAAGVGTIGLVEFDEVDLSNIQRQVLYATDDVGRPKLAAAVPRLERLNPEVEIVSHAEPLIAANAMEIVGGYDIVADGTDNFPTRYLINDACVLSGKPDVYASIYRFDGQVSVFDAARGPCYRCLFPEPPPPGLVPSCAEGGVLGVLPGILGSMQGLEVLKWILGVGDPLVGRLVLFDGLAFRIREMAVEKDPDCPVCGTRPTIRHLGPGAAGCEVRPGSPGIATIGVEEFRARREAGEPLELLDVRERHEFRIVRIPGAREFPLSELPSRLHELDSARAYTISCHRGIRSVQAVQLLRRAGFAKLQVLEGGVDAWAERIDPSLPRY